MRAVEAAPAFWPWFSLHSLQDQTRGSVPSQRRHTTHPTQDIFLSLSLHLQRTLATHLIKMLRILISSSNVDWILSVFSHRDTGNSGGRAPDSDRAATHTHKTPSPTTHSCEISSQSLALKTSAIVNYSRPNTSLHSSVPLAFWLPLFHRRTDRPVNIINSL